MSRRSEFHPLSPGVSPKLARAATRSSVSPSIVSSQPIALLVRERGQEQPAEVAPVGLGRQEAVEQALERLAPEGGLAREARLAEQLERVRVAQGRAQRPGDPLLPLRVAVEDVQEVAQARHRGRARRGRGLGALEAVRAPHPAGDAAEPPQPRLEGSAGSAARQEAVEGGPPRGGLPPPPQGRPRLAEPPSLDPPAAQADLAVVEDDGLAGRDRPLRRVEAHLGAAAAQGPDRGLRLRVAVADARAGAERAGRLGDGQPAHVPRHEPVGEELLLVPRPRPRASPARTART